HGSALGRALERFADEPLAAAQKVQFEQLDRCSWRVRIESHQTPDFTQLERQVASLMHEVLGAGCRTQTEVVPKIERERSGKFRYYRSPSTRGNGRGGAAAVD